MLLLCIIKVIWGKTKMYTLWLEIIENKNKHFSFTVK